MTRRVVFGNSGGTFRFRATRPGFNANTAPMGDAYQIHEDMQPMAAVESGQVAVAANNEVHVSLSQTYAFPPLCLLSANDGAVMGDFVWGRYLPALNQLRIYNTSTVTKTVRWALLADFFL
jgi:hypothetical protein